MSDVIVTLTYTETEAREVMRALKYFDSNVTATFEDHDRMNLIRSAIGRALPPPKPDEPTGDGAVVVDRMGYRWVRVASQNDSIQSPPWRHRGHQARFWEHVNAVEVLSEGVRP